MIEIRDLPYPEQLLVARQLVDNNQLLTTPKDLLANIGRNKLYVKLDIGLVYCVGFKYPGEQFKKTVEDLGLMEPILEKGWTLRIGGNSQEFQDMNKLLTINAKLDNPECTIVARMRVENFKAIWFNFKNGFTPVGVYEDCVNHEKYLLTQLLD